MRRHFWASAIRGLRGDSVPRNPVLNGTIRAFVNSRDGSLSGTIRALGTIRWERSRKKSRKLWRISEPVIPARLTEAPEAFERVSAVGASGGPVEAGQRRRIRGARGGLRSTELASPSTS